MHHGYNHNLVEIACFVLQRLRFTDTASVHENCAVNMSTLEIDMDFHPN